MSVTLALLASPLLGPSVWQPSAVALTDRGWPTVTAAMTRAPETPQDALDSFLAQLPRDEDLVLVPHSNAGAYVPALIARRRVAAAVFVDAILPPRAGEVALAPAEFLTFLHERADAHGVLPVWTSWWDEPDIPPLIDDVQVRTRVEAEQHQLPVSYFSRSLPAQPGWDRRPMAYLAFGDTYRTERADAAARSWPVTTMPTGHLRLVNDPEHVAAEVTTLLDQLGLTTGRGRAEQR